MDYSTPGLPVHHQLPEFTQTHIQDFIRSVLFDFHILWIFSYLFVVIDLFILLGSENTSLDLIIPRFIKTYLMSQNMFCMFGK